MNDYEINENFIDFISEPSLTLTVYVPEFSHPGPPAMANVAYPPLDLTETCSAHTSSLFWFIIDKFTILEFTDMPLIEMRSVWAYEDKSVWTDNSNWTSDTTSGENESDVFEDKIATAAIIAINAIPPTPKINFEFFGRVLELREEGVSNVWDCSKGMI